MRTTRYTDGKSKEEILAEAKDLIEDTVACSQDSPNVIVYWGGETIKIIDFVDHLKNLTPIGIDAINCWHDANAMINSIISKKEIELRKFEKRWEPWMLVLVGIAIAGFLFLVGAGIKVLFFS